MKFHKEMTQKAVYSLPNIAANVKHMEKKIQNLGHISVVHTQRRSSKHHCTDNSNKLHRAVMTNGQ